MKKLLKGETLLFQENAHEVNLHIDDTTLALVFSWLVHVQSIVMACDGFSILELLFLLVLDTLPLMHQSTLFCARNESVTDRMFALALVAWLSTGERQWAFVGVIWLVQPPACGRRGRAHDQLLSSSPCMQQ